MGLLSNFGKKAVTHAKNTLHEADEKLSGDQDGEYVNNHKWIDIHKSGVRKTNGRLRNIYDQSQQNALNHPDDEHIQPAWWVGAVIAFFVVLILGFKILPSISHVFPFDLFPIQYKFTFGTVMWIFILAIAAGGATMGVFALNANMDSMGRKASREVLADDYNDAYIEMPNELPHKYDIAPDNKAHFSIDVTALLSHLMIKDTYRIKGKDGKVHFDEQFAQELFDVADLPHTNPPRMLYDAARLLYNPDNSYSKHVKGRTVQDAINNSWHVPDYEDPDSQDPAGAYIVSTGPENTILVSETRGGKGQKYIEPILDVWSRQDKKPNIVVTDLKMELLRMMLKTFTIRGYNVKSLNLLVESKTDAINFIGYAADAAIRGNVTKMEELVSNIADIYFPKGGGSQDPMWNNAASTVFKRTVYGLIDYYNEEVRKMRNDPTISSATLLQKSDEAWGHVTLYNAYKFVVETAAKSYPKAVYQDIYPTIDGNSTDPDPQAEYKSGLTVYFDATARLPQNAIREKIANQDKALKASAKSEKMLASIYGICLFGMIFFTDDKVIKLTSARPSANLDLTGFAFPRRMAVRFDKHFADKHSLIGSIAVWHAYKDPAMEQPYTTEKHGKTILDPNYHFEGTVDSNCWADAFFKGCFPSGKPTYLKLVLYDQAGYKSGSSMNLKLQEFDFVFKKNYRRSYTGRSYLQNPLNGEREVQGGTMVEYTYDKRSKKVHHIISNYHQREHSLVISQKGAIVDKKFNIINGYDIHYTDKPTALFLVAPPSTPGYNKILLITIDMLYNQQVSSAFLAFSDQKPITITKYLLDEFGNMQSNGKGVPNLALKLSSGLGQGQQFTLVLQSMSQLKTIYSADVENTLSANVATYFYMKSKDKQMINMLIDMNGKKHVAQMTSSSSEKPIGGFHFFDALNGKDQRDSRPRVNQTFSRDERPVLNENDYLRLNDDASDGNAIVTRGTNPIVSMGQTIMPMSYKLLENRTGGRGDDIIPTNPPTMANTTEFDPLQNLPNFDKMIAQRIDEAKWAPKVIAQYKTVEHKTDRDIELIDKDTFANRIMLGIWANIKDTSGQKKDPDKIATHGDFENQDEQFNTQFGTLDDDAQDEYTKNALNAGDQHANYFDRHADTLREKIRRQAQKAAFDIDTDENGSDTLTKMQQSQVDNKYFNKNNLDQEMEDMKIKRYADHKLSKRDLVTGLSANAANDVLDNQDIGDGRTPTGSYDDILSEAFADTKQAFSIDSKFILKHENNGDNLYLASNHQRLISEVDEQLDKTERYRMETPFALYLTDLPTWQNIAGGKFDQAVSHYLDEKGNQTDQTRE